ncbi:neuraminidase-like domain-containing protein [Photorhabdus khanii]|uniref:Tc toxin subunit A-related protein n=1 Tax=Photorhabdus khanii TaxID=1004150 RepID=UPI001F026F82|nr:neuraminidase-like domain-containing protein [Photorhabdus khanii]
MSTLTPERPEITQQKQKANRLHEASILKRANPQLQNAVHLAITEPHDDQQGYNSKFGGRASQYVAPGAVSSMFSPAAYLTELYRQARGLHADNSDYHLDKRRPDLKLLTLSQQNMDDEISTLSLSNKVLLEGIKTLTGLEGHTNVMKTLSTFRPSGSMPYHDAYENVRKVIQLQAPVFEQFNESPKIADLMYQTSLLGINAFISPELFNILVEKITDDEEEIKRLYGENFGNIEPALMATPEKLKSYYNLTDEELNQFTDQQKIKQIHEEMHSEYPSQQPAQYYLLILNKIIRLSQATGLTPTILKSIISSSTYQEVSTYPEITLEAVITVYNELNDGPDIDAEILKKISRVKCYMQRYGIDAETALILCNVPISGNIYSGSPSQLFNRLFNTPPLDGQNFSTSDEKEIDLNLGSTNDWRKAVLKRAFNVDDDLLKRLFKITNRSNNNGKIIHSVENLSYLYLAKLLADIHQLTIDELDLLLVAIGEGTTHLSGINDENLAALIDKLYAVTNWLRTQKWSMYQLLVITTTDYNKTLTPEIQNLLDTVYNGLQGFNSENEENLLLKISPYIAAALQLPSENIAHYVLTWADQLKPSAGKVTAGKFLGWLQALRDPKQPKSTVTQEQAVQYCQCLAQLALIYRSTGLSERTLRLFVEKPQLFGIKAGTAPTHDTLITLTRFTDWVNSLGEKASSVLTEFEKGTLEAKQLADAMSLDKNLLEQASTQAQADFANWTSIDTILQWINIARQLNISPQSVSDLVELLTATLPQTYDKWENVATILTTGLDIQKTNALHTFLDESRSATLSAYYIYIHKVVGLMRKLSTFRTSGTLPYHDAYERVHKIIQLQEPKLKQSSAPSAITGLIHQSPLLGIHSAVSPELFNILTEEITEENAEALYKKNFGNIELASLAMLEYLKRYYNLSDEELSQFIGEARNFGQQEYSNNQLITPVVNRNDGTVKVYRITREYTKNADQVDVELFPLGDENYQLNYTFKDSLPDVSYLAIKLNDERVLIRTKGAPQFNIKSSENITLSTTDISQPLIIVLKLVYSSDSWDYAAAKFTVEEYNQYPFLLKLNKAIRLSHATKLSPTILESIVRSVNQQLDINAEVLDKVFLTKYYMQHYDISAEIALILCNVLISQRSYDNQPSQFDSLFNTPLLNDQYFSTKDEEIDLNPGSTGDWRKSVLKRAFNIDDISLYRLLKITNHNNQDGKIKNNLKNLSDLYIGKLLAEIHQLTIDELGLLLVAVGEGKTNLSAISYKQLETLIKKLNTITGWLQTQKWSVSQLLDMTATSYNKTLIPELNHLLETILDGLQGLDKDKIDLLHVMAPYIAAILQLPSKNVAHSVLLWAGKLQPGDGAMTAEKFWDWWFQEENISSVMEEQTFQYLHTITQLALIYHSTGLSENAFRLFVTKPQLFSITSGTVPTHDTSSLIMLTRFADWIKSLGEKATSVLDEFEKGTLTAKQLADAMNLDENLLLQASTQVQTHNQIINDNAFSCWTSIDAIQQWVNIARQLNVSPPDVSALMKLQAEKSTYVQWENIATILTAGLDTQQANTLHTFLDESRSAALSTYYIANKDKDAEIKNRDDLYQYLLIDNQVSAAIKTTPIAEAITSIQLYVNRALKNMEGNAVPQVVNQPFFTNWDKYNKRYSTWAGIAKLVYYPENYIDPTIRIGRTKMMDTLLQSISQSQLNTDTVENAFMSYLTSFEQVANLEVVSAYHDNANSDQGLTYFIGHSKTEVNQYYWRNVDHNKFSGGKFPANAWSEWYKIDCPMNPYKNTIRPVIFQSRLYLIWLEQKKISKQTESNHQTVEHYHYELKLAHIRYDGTWNTPINFDVNDRIFIVSELEKLERELIECREKLKKSEEQLTRQEKNLEKENDSRWRESLEQAITQQKMTVEHNKIQKTKKLQEIHTLQEKPPGFYCTNHQDTKLLVIFYQKQDAPDKYKTEAPIKGLHISSNMLPEDTNPGDYITHIRNQLDVDIGVNSIIKVNNRYEISSSVKIGDNNILTLHHDTNGAQYMQWRAYRTRLNTLFARQLVNRANTGIDTILSMETQKLPEPQLGEGTFVQLVLDKYNATIHGTNKSFSLEYFNVFKNSDNFVIYQGELSETNQTSVTVFLPYLINAFGNKNHLWVRAKYQKETTGKILFDRTDATNPHGWFLNSKYQLFTGLLSAQALKNDSEPMDFSGANALYFWELFYYVPMLIAQRLLHEQNFDEANRWLKYIWNPSGYIEHGQIQHDNWNVRPLLEDTSWNDDPLNSVDPDAIAQYDPMHYKVVTFMRTLDLLLDRGDYAYRQLERDTLNEAKMWYMQALHLLGDKPHLSFNSEWSKPSLGDAARTEKQEEHAQAITSLRQGDVSRHKNPTDLFLPQVNEVMQNYWQKLEQRLYNLRHNLSIDGQPLHLPIYATPADPKALLSAAVANSQGSSALSQPFMSLWRFPHMLENARGMVNQLTQFGSTLQNIIERQDAEALNVLLQNQAKELILTNMSIQNKTIEELDAEKTVLEKSKTGAQSRFDSYSKLYDENINAGENQVMTLHASVAGISTSLKASRLAGAALDLAPNLFGLADGGCHWGAIAKATGDVMEFSTSVMNTEADKISQSEAYRRRRQEWEIQRNNAETELKQIDAQLSSLAIRREAAVLQKTSLKTQQEQTHAQLVFLQRKFSNQTLYNWLRGRLAAIYFQFYDLTVARCLMAEMAYRWETNNTAASFIKPGAWQGTHAGLLAGETLMLNLAQMEDAHLRWDQRALEVERTVSLADVYTESNKNRIDLTAKITDLLEKRKDNLDSNDNGIRLNDNKLIATVNLASLEIHKDYPASVGETRRIKQISVTLPALLGPYQDVQAILSYGESETGLAESCKSLAVSHGMNDSGQFQLDFNNGKFLPFEGIAINDTGTLTLSFPNATDKQKNMLQTLNDIILHIRYTIRQ